MKLFLLVILLNVNMLTYNREIDFWIPSLSYFEINAAPIKSSITFYCVIDSKFCRVFVGHKVSPVRKNRIIGPSFRYSEITISCIDTEKISRIRAFLIFVVGRMKKLLHHGMIRNRNCIFNVTERKHVSWLAMSHSVDSVAIYMTDYSGCECLYELYNNKHFRILEDENSHQDSR